MNILLPIGRIIVPTTMALLGVDRLSIG